MIGGTDQTSTGRDRYQGYVNALRKAEIEVDPNLRIPGPRSMQGGFEAAVHFLSLPQKPTAAVCWNDLVAIGLMNGIARAGLVPGTDISVTGYDDLEEASISTPALTTVWNGQAEVGRLAARALLDRLAGSHEPDGIHLIKPEMRIRQSTSPYQTPPVRSRGKAMSRIAILVPGKIHERVLSTLKDRFEVVAVEREETLKLDAETASRIRGVAVCGAFPGKWMDQLPNARSDRQASVSVMTASTSSMLRKRASSSPTRRMC